MEEEEGAAMVMGIVAVVVVVCSLRGERREGGQVVVQSRSDSVATPSWRSWSRSPRRRVFSRAGRG